jgi:hypothetical protein
MTRICGTALTACRLVAIGCVLGLAGCANALRSPQPSVKLLNQADVQTLAGARFANIASSELTPPQREAIATAIKNLEAECTPRLAGERNKNK